MPEMLVVLVIITFATSIALLAYGNYRKTSTVRSAAEKIKRVMIEARSRAIADGRPSQVVFDLTEQTIWVDDLDGTGQLRAPKVVEPEFLGRDIILETVQVQNTTVSTGLARATFFPDGTNPLTKVILRRSDSDANVDDSYFTVQIYPSSAEPRVWPNARR